MDTLSYCMIQYHICTIFIIFLRLAYSFELCNINNNHTFCDSFSVYPQNSEITSTVVTISHTDDDAETTFIVEFTVKHVACLNPTITFAYEQIDTLATNERIKIRDNDNNLIRNCQGNGGEDIQCGIWWTCLDQYSLGISEIPIGSTYKIYIVEGEGTDALCTDYHPYSINAKLTLCIACWIINMNTP